ncbi:MAG: response regulator [Candidatus Poseidoniales archaeon]|nr:response regulator [Candidatus Poseidoniales archaeon]
MSADESKTALIVIGNPITEGQLQMALRKRGWAAEIVKDGDKAVDEFVALRPDLVFIAVDIPTLNGHVAALEMRESDPKARVVFVSSRGRMDLAEDAAYSAGAVGVLMTPFTNSSVEEAWEQWMGGIPEAPGLTDLDALYPTLEDPEPEPPTFPPLPGMPPLPENPPLPSEDVELPPVLPTNPVSPPPTKQDSKGRWIIRLILLLIIAGGAVGGAHYAGLLDLNALLDQIPI